MSLETTADTILKMNDNVIAKFFATHLNLKLEGKCASPPYYEYMCGTTTVAVINIREPSGQYNYTVRTMNLKKFISQQDKSIRFFLADFAKENIMEIDEGFFQTYLRQAQMAEIESCADESAVIKIQINQVDIFINHFKDFEFHEELINSVKNLWYGAKLVHEGKPRVPKPTYEEYFRLKYTIKSDFSGPEFIAFTPDDKFFITAYDHGWSDGYLVFWNVSDFSIHNKIRIDDSVKGIAFSPNRKLVAIESGRSEGATKIWMYERFISKNLNADEFIQKINSHYTSAGSLHFFSDNNRILTAGGDRTVHIINLVSSKSEFRMGYSDIPFLAMIAKDETKYYTIDRDRDLTLIDLTLVEKNRENASKSVKGFSCGSNLSYSPDKKLIAASDGSAIVFVDPESLERIAKLEGHKTRIEDFAFHPTMNLLVSGEENGIINIWDLADNKKVSEVLFPGTLRKLSLSQDGRLLVALGNNRSMLVWEFVK